MHVDRRQGELSGYIYICICIHMELYRMRRIRVRLMCIKRTDDGRISLNALVAK